LRQRWAQRRPERRPEAREAAAHLAAELPAALESQADAGDARDALAAATERANVHEERIDQLEAALGGKLDVAAFLAVSASRARALEARTAALAAAGGGGGGSGGAAGRRSRQRDEAST
jgi:hypothetical protein